MLRVFSVYYRAQVVKNSIWLVTGFLRSAEGYVLERTLDGTGDIVEFFVSSSCVDDFEKLMIFLTHCSLIRWHKKMPNRLEHELLLDREV